MSRYRELVRESIASTGDVRTDDATCALVEDWMRIDRIALDGLTAREFDWLASECFADLREADVEFVRQYCDACQLEVPEWARKEPSTT
jgi:hypothetical protein